MDQSKALQKLTESADLIGMIEDLVRVSQSERLSAATISGMRHTLRNIRESILASHDQFASDLVIHSRSRNDSLQGTLGTSTAASSSEGDRGEPIQNGSFGPMAAGLSDPSRLGIRRQSLRASLEKISE